MGVIVDRAFCLADCLGAFWWLLLVAVPFGIGAVAQLGERRNRTAEVGGSIPLGSTMILVLKENKGLHRPVGCVPVLSTL